MNRLFLRFSLGMMVVLVASFFVVRWGARHGAERLERGGKLSSLFASMDHARRRLEQVTAQQMPGVMKKLREEISAPVKLLPLSSKAIPARALHQLNDDRLYINSTHRRGRTIYLPLRGRERVLVLGPLEPFFHKHFFPTGLVLSALIAIIALTGFLLAAPIVRRLRRLEQTAVMISEGQLQARAEDSAGDAIGSLARRFNIMADRVQDLLESQRQLIQAVAHELRTPLARLRFGLEMLSSADTGDERARRLVGIDEDLTELDELVEELLLFIRAGEKALRLDKTSVDALDEISRVVERARELRPEISVQVEAHDLEEAAILVDPKAFRRAIQNLLANAVKVARGRVTIRIRNGEDTLSISICDDGPGIPQEDRKRIFEPFTRLDHSRNRDSGGSGLGLAIVRRIVDAHQGTITIESAEEGGAQFTTTWRSAAPQGAERPGHHQGATPMQEGPIQTDTK